MEQIPTEEPLDLNLPGPSADNYVQVGYSFNSLLNCWVCSFCGLFFEYRSRLERHLPTHAPNNQTLPPPENLQHPVHSPDLATYQLYVADSEENNGFGNDSLSDPDATAGTNFYTICLKLL
jgi:hypothetical protein